MSEAEFIESRVLREEASSFIHTHARLQVERSEWTISIYRVTFPTREFYVQAVHHGTGALVPANGDPYVERSLGRARDRAGRLATVIRGTLDYYDWRAGKQLHRTG